MIIRIFRFALLSVTVMLCALPSMAVLPENDIDRTLIMLSTDMKVLQQNISRDLLRFENRQKEFGSKCESLSETFDETAVVLYSQDERYMYGTLQATQGMKNVIEQIESLNTEITRLEGELGAISNRYGMLSTFLRSIDVRNLSHEADLALRSSLNITDSLHQRITECLQWVESDKAAYKHLSAKAQELDQYSDKVISRLQTEIFQTGNENIRNIFTHLPHRLMEFANDLEWRFFTGQSHTDTWRTQQERFDKMLDINNCIAVIIAIGFFFITRIKKFCPGWIKSKRPYYSLIFGLAVKVGGLVVIRFIVGSGYQFGITLIIDAELALLALLIVVSATLRLDLKQIAGSLTLYLPTYCTTFLLLAFREALVPISTITISVPIIITTALIAQVILMISSLCKVDQFDRGMAWGNISNLIIALLVAYCGHTVLATIIFLLWIGMETGLLLIGLVKSELSERNPDPNSVFAMTLRIFVYPLALPAIVLSSCVWVAHLHNLSLWFWEMLSTPFIDMPDKIGVISVSRLISIYALGICVNYLAALIKSLLHRKAEYRQGQVAVAISIGNILAWLLYTIVVLIILDINKTGLIAAIGGASVGVGFALKDTFENFFSGMSLMAGRLRPGDILEYEGARGKVLDIGIITTTMETEDGPIMTMPNRQLFEKNFRNMTRNNHVELRHITFDISVDNDPGEVRELILECIGDIDGIDNTRRHVVIMRNFGRGIMRVELKVWIDSEKYLATEPAVREAVFEAFRNNGIRRTNFIEKIEANCSANIMTDNITII